ncbi:MAG: type I 3-dehydroquinate dehydratase [Candidatus Peribacteraceae bacterium]|nr:type I 3-dehydroquinate dehydratase [Candidatus Peribacteraceae bacterium]
MFVVTLPPSAAKNPQAFALKAKREGADILEIRSDLTPGVQPFRSTLPLLVSVRGTNDSLVDLLTPAFVDIEESSDAVWLPKRAKLILSFHDHDATPSLAVLKATANRMRKEKPWAIKIATFVKSYNDLVTLKKLQDWLVSTGQRSIVLGMGPKAHLSRVTSPFCNVFTYAMLDPADAAAPGQLPMSFYALMKGRKHPKLFGILGGAHITASLSPVIHNALFSRHKIDALYSCFPSDDFAAVTTLHTLGIKGLSVTAPFKRKAFEIASTLEPISEKLGVANTLIRSGTKWRGFLTDAYGIEEGYGALSKAKNVAILGAGGAVPSAILAVRSRSPKAVITVFARDVKKAKKTLQAFGVNVDVLENAASFTADAVICAVSADIALPVPSPESKKSIAIDLRYGKETEFMKTAKRKKFRVHNGTNMLIHQALKQFRHFTGKTPYDDDETFLRPILTSFLSSHGQ